MIYVLGSINLDLIATGERLPLPGETVSAKDFVTAPGGKGANQALAAARAGAKVKMIGAVGSDDFVKKALSELKAGNVDLAGVQVIDGPTGIAIIIVDQNGENVIVIVPGANGGVGEQIANQTVEQMSATDILVMVQEIPAQTLLSALKGAKAKGIKTILNIAPVIPQTIELAALADMIVANETEFALLLGQKIDNDDIVAIGAKWAKTHNKTLVITLGGAGALALTPSEKIVVSALKIDPVDTVGAGDTFCGYLAAGLQAGLGLESALGQAAAAGSLACLKPGAQPAIPWAQDVVAALGT